MYPTTSLISISVGSVFNTGEPLCLLSKRSERLILVICSYTALLVKILKESFTMTQLTRLLHASERLRIFCYICMFICYRTLGSGPEEKNRNESRPRIIFKKSITCLFGNLALLERTPKLFGRRGQPLLSNYGRSWSIL